MNYWLMKCEPNVYSIDDLARDGTTSWEGVRNYQARNFMKQMAVGDIAFFYHSNADPSGIAGLMHISNAAYADPFQLQNGHKYFEPRATPDNLIWVSVDVTFDRKFDQVLSLASLKKITHLDGLEVLRQGSRLSIQPVSKAHFDRILEHC